MLEITIFRSKVAFIYVHGIRLARHRRLSVVGIEWNVIWLLDYFSVHGVDDSDVLQFLAKLSAHASSSVQVLPAYHLARHNKIMF